MEWEIQWVQDNPQYYEGPYHQKAVIENIKKRYERNVAQNYVKNYAAYRTAFYKHEMFEYFGVLNFYLSAK